MSSESLAAALARAGSPVELLRNLTLPAEHLPGEARVHELALRAAVVGGDLRAARPVPPHDGPLHRGPRRAAAAQRHRRQHLRELRRRQGQAVRRREPRRLPDRRRHPLPPRGGAVRPRRAPDGDRLGDLQPGARRLRGHRRARRQLRGADVGAAQALPVRAPGPHRRRPHRAGERCPAPGREVLQHGRVHHRRPPRPRAAARHGRPARLRAVRPLGGRGRRPLRPAGGRARTTASCGSAPRPTRRPTWSPGGCRRR